jgi:hypothetical protein
MFRGNEEARMLGFALRDAADGGHRVPCDGLDAVTVRPSACTARPLAEREARGYYGRASGSIGAFGGVRIKKIS